MKRPAQMKAPSILAKTMTRKKLESTRPRVIATDGKCQPNLKSPRDEVFEGLGSACDDLRQQEAKPLQQHASTQLYQEA